VAQRTKRKYANTLSALDIFDDQRAGVQFKLFRKKESLSESEIGVLILAAGGVGRVLRPAAPSDPGKYIEKLGENANDYADNGIDADPPK
jgi:hypothetical protein